MGVGPGNRTAAPGARSRRGWFPALFLAALALALAVAAAPAVAQDPSTAMLMARAYIFSYRRRCVPSPIR